MDKARCSGAERWAQIILEASPPCCISPLTSTDTSSRTGIVKYDISCGGQFLESVGWVDVMALQEPWRSMILVAGKAPASAPTPSEKVSADYLL
jgi:hypothetical protein